MKRTIVGILIIWAMSSVVPASNSGATRAGGDEADLEALVDGWDRALVRRDHSFIERILADDFTYIGATGQVQTRAQLLAQLRDERLRIEQAESTDVRVRVYGDTAVVVARGRTRGQFDGTPFTNEYRFTDVWVRRDGRWQAVATQVTGLPRGDAAAPD